MVSNYEGMTTPSLFSEDNEAMLLQLPKVPDDYVPEVLPPTGKKLIIEVNEARVEEVLGRLLRALEANEPPYNQDHVRVAQDPRHMPETLKRGGVEHAMFWFKACYYMRGRIKSNLAIPKLARIYDDHPELFDCPTASSLDEAELASILSQYHLGRHLDIAGDWIENAKRLQERYGGDPRNIFDGVTTYEQSQERIQNDDKGSGFIGFREKMTSMIIYYLAAEGLIKPFIYPIPVDLHVLRISIANELITFPNAPNGTNLYTDETTAVLRKLYSDYAAKHDVTPVKLCDAVWMLSESSCGHHPGNKTVEPFGRSFRTEDGKRYMVPGVVDINNSSQQAAYASSCGICPIEKYCNHNVPGGPYYASNHLIMRGDRERGFSTRISMARRQGRLALFDSMQSSA